MKGLLCVENECPVCYIVMGGIEKHEKKDSNYLNDFDADHRVMRM